MKKIAALIIVVLALLQCTNNTPLPNGYELLDRDNKVGLAPLLTLRPTRVAQYWHHMPSGPNTSMLLGVGKDVQSYIILQCRNLIKVDTSRTLVSATLVMRSRYYMGDNSPFTLTAHRVTQEWNEPSVLWDDVKDAYDPNPVEIFELTPQDTTWYNIPFTDLQFMGEWILDAHKAVQDIKGLILKFDQAESGNVFATSEATIYPPYFEIVTKDDDGNEETTLAYLSHDAGLMQNLSGVEENVLEDGPATLKAGNGTGYRSLLYFDVSEIPREATIHKALLTFYIDHQEIYVPVDSILGAYSVAARHIVEDSTWSDATAIVADSLYRAAVDGADANNDTFAFDSTSPVQTMSRMIQRWVSGVAPNYGVMISPNYQNLDFQEMAFKSGVADTVVAPTLEITYSLPAAHRFARP